MNLIIPIIQWAAAAAVFAVFTFAGDWTAAFIFTGALLAGILLDAWIKTNGPMRFIAKRLHNNPKLVAWLFAYAQRNSVGIEHLPGYMNRWYLFNPVNEATRRRKWNWIPLSIRFHEILRRDEDRHQHDHPWNAQSIILRGFYIEQRDNPDFDEALPEAPDNRPFRVYIREAGDIARLDADTAHRIVSVSEEPPPLTLFFYGRWQKGWGFYTEGGFVPWREYLEEGEVQRAAELKAAEMKATQRAAELKATLDELIGYLEDVDGEPMAGPDDKHAREEEAREFGWGGPANTEPRT